MGRRSFLVFTFNLYPNKQSGRKPNKQEKEPHLKKRGPDPGCRPAGFRKHRSHSGITHPGHFSPPGFCVSAGLKDTCKPVCPALTGCLNHTAAAGPEALCSSPPQTFIPDPRLLSRHRCWSRRQSVGFFWGGGNTLYEEARPLQFCEERSVI